MHPAGSPVGSTPAFPRAQWLPPRRPRQIHLPQLRTGKKYGGQFNLRFDDTNPAKEGQEYVDAIRDDVHWLGADWEGREFYASDYFNQLYDWAEQLIRAGKAYVCDLGAEEVAKTRGGIKGGTDSPYRNRGVDENLDLLRA